MGAGSPLEGDPDRPIITGRVYNADQTVPYALPAEQTKSTIKSMSSKGGGGFNEIRLEDKAGSEQIFIFGQKDQHIRIKNDIREWVGEDTSLYVTRDRKDQTGRDDHDDIGRDHIEKIGRDHHLTVSGKEAISITGSHSMSVTGDVIEAFSGNQSTQVTQNLYISGMQVVIQATTGMTLSVGGNFITAEGSSLRTELVQSGKLSKIFRYSENDRKVRAHFADSMPFSNSTCTRRSWRNWMSTLASGCRYRTWSSTRGVTVGKSLRATDDPPSEPSSRSKIPQRGACSGNR